MEYDPEGQTWSRYEQAYWETLLQLVELLISTDQDRQRSALVKLLSMVLKERLTLSSVVNDDFFEECDVYWWLSKFQVTGVKLSEDSLNHLKFRYMLLDLKV